MLMSDWRNHALCIEVGPDPFFPNVGDSVKAAKRICSRCPVMDRCLAYALDSREPLVGIWGGTTPRERARMRRAAAA